MSYLDDTGLAYFWTKLKAWVASAASNLVHRTGQEYISGRKTFEQPGPVVHNDEISLTQNPASTLYDEIYFVGSGYDYSDLYIANSIGVSRLAELKYAAASNGTRSFVLCPHVLVDNADASAEFGIRWDPVNQIFHGSSPSTSSLRSNGTDVVTRDWLPQDTRLVHTSGSEDIYGNKTFYNHFISLHNDNIDNSVNPSVDRTSSFIFTDTNGIRLGMLQHYKHTGGSNATYIECRKPGVTNEGTGLYVGYDTDGNKWASAPSTSSSRTNGGDILTRDWIPNDTRIVHTTGDETIHGGKVFNHHYMVLKSTTVEYNVTPANNIATSYLFNDKNGQLLGGVQYLKRNTANWDYLHLWCTKHNDLNTSSDLYLGFDANGNKYFAAPQTRTVGTNDTDVLTYSWIPNDTRIVHTTGDERISGHKSFLNEPFVICNFTNNSAVSSNIFASYEYRDNNSSNPHRLGGLEFAQRTDHVNRRDVKLFIYPATNASMYGVSLDLTNSGNTRTFRPLNDNDMGLGVSSQRWKQVFAGTATISTSDRRCKDFISDPDDVLLDAWDGIGFRVFKFTDAIGEKGANGARVHCGLVAQDVDSVLSEAGLDASRYAFFCHDVWEAAPPSYREDGSLEDPGREAGDRYSLRYEEALCIEAAYQRRENARLKKRIADLEERLAALELKIS